MLGGAVGLAARQRGVAGQVTGLVRRVESVGECLAAGAVDAATQDLAEALDGSALVILCTPVGDMADMAALLQPHLAVDDVVTDVHQQDLPNHQAVLVWPSTDLDALV